MPLARQDQKIGKTGNVTTLPGFMTACRQMYQDAGPIYRHICRTQARCLHFDIQAFDFTHAMSFIVTAPVSQFQGKSMIFCLAFDKPYDTLSEEERAACNACLDKWLLFERGAAAYAKVRHTAPAYTLDATAGLPLHRFEPVKNRVRHIRFQ